MKGNATNRSARQAAVPLPSHGPGADSDEEAASDDHPSPASVGRAGVPGPPGRGHGDASLLLASVAAAASGPHAQHGLGLLGTWVTGHLGREDRQSRSQDTLHRL